MKLVVGLGNPGAHYAGNRHNLGAMCLSYFAKAHGIPLDRKQANARTGTGVVAGIPVLLARPQTYMNLSGESVSLLVRKLHTEPEDFIVIHDDLDLPVGRVRLRRDGGSGGHKGIESIIARTGSAGFIRIRVGIGRPPGDTSEDEIASYVLSDFTLEEKRILERVIPAISEALHCLLAEGLTAAMNKYNRDFAAVEPESKEKDS